MFEINRRIKELRSTLSVDGRKMTLEKFGNAIGVSAQAVSAIEREENLPSDQTIKMICREFNVSEAWLRDGEGEPFLAMDRDDEIMEAVGRILAESPDSFRRRWISVMCRLTPAEWETLEKICKEMFGNDSGNGKGNRKTTNSRCF